MAKLDPKAVTTANEKLWANNPELARRQLTLGPEDTSYRKEWMKHYREAVGKHTPPEPKNQPQPADPPPDTPASEPCIPCALKATCKELWAKYEAETRTISDMSDPIERNKKISAAYANMYMRRKELKWSGAAAFASKQVGCGMTSAKVAIANPPAGAVGWVPGLPSKEKQKEMAQTMLDGLGKGNKAVFEEMYPAMRFYEDHGAQQVKDCADSREPPLAEPIVQGLMEAENGNDELGALMMLENEQKITLQQEVYDNKDFEEVIKTNQSHVTALYGSVAKKFGAEEIKVHFSSECNSGESVTFTGKNLADYNERLPYAKSVAEKFNGLAKGNPAGTEAELSKIIKAGE